MLKVLPFCAFIWGDVCLMGSALAYPAEKVINGK